MWGQLPATPRRAPGDAARWRLLKGPGPKGTERAAPEPASVTACQSLARHFLPFPYEPETVTVLRTMRALDHGLEIPVLGLRPRADGPSGSPGLPGPRFLHRHLLPALRPVLPLLAGPERVQRLCLWPQGNVTKAFLALFPQWPEPAVPARSGPSAERGLHPQAAPLPGPLSAGRHTPGNAGTTGLRLVTNNIQILTSECSRNQLRLPLTSQVPRIHVCLHLYGSLSLPLRC